MNLGQLCSAAALQARVGVRNVISVQSPGARASVGGRRHGSAIGSLHR